MTRTLPARIFFCAIATILFAAAIPPAHAASHFLYEVRIPFRVAETATARTADGRIFELGHVVKLPEQTRWPSYTASAWGKPGAVTASAVNALHILMGVEDGKGRTMSVIPAETIAPAAGAGAAIVLDSPAGTGFFGAWAPPVGTAILLETPGSAPRPLNEVPLPQEGDALLFRVYEEDMPYMIDFENRPGGRVTAWDRNGATLVARVIRPVAGVGRFGGTLFQDAGRIRANHSGVVDVSTCPRGHTGGFQIIPWDHALSSSEMQGAWSATQWMILGPADGKSPMGGTYPLFHGGLVPGTAEGEQLWDIWSTYGRKPLVLARLDGGHWQHLPVAEGKVDDALKSVTHLRIYFPLSREPLTEEARR